MPTNNYAARPRSGETNREGGYKNLFWFAPRDTFTSIKMPTATPSAAGDTVKVTTTDTFSTGNGYIPWIAKKHAVTHTSETTGDEGSQSFTHKFSITLLGDDATTLEQMKAMLNDDIIIQVKDQNCLNTAETIRFGNDCVTADLKISFDGKTTKEGLKEYKIEGTIKDCKYFYSGTITEKP